MKTRYQDLDLSLNIDGISIDILTLISERFTRTIPIHSHGSNCYEIHYIPYGYGKLTANGRSYDIIPNTLYVTGPHIKHAQFPNADNPMVEYCVYLRIQKNLQDKKSSDLIKNFTSKDFWFGNDSQDIGGTLRQIFAELEQKNICYKKQVELLLSTILIQIVRNYEQTYETKKGRVISALGNESPALTSIPDNKSRIIEEYFLYEYNSLSLTTLSARLNLSPRQTQRLLKEYYNKSFSEKKAEARMSAAAILLRDRKRSISEIAETLGFSSPEHFSTVFHKFYNTTPRDFRKTTDTH